MKCGISVKALVARTKAGQTPDQILVSYPFLTRGEIYAALAYYEMNRDEIDGALTEDERLCDENTRDSSA